MATGAIRYDLRVSTWRFRLALRFVRATVWCLTFFPRWRWGGYQAARLVDALRRGMFRLIDVKVAR